MMIMTSFRKALDSSWYHREAAQSKSFFVSSVDITHLDYLESDEEKERSQEGTMIDRSIVWLTFPLLQQVFIEKSHEKMEPLAKSLNRKRVSDEDEREELLTFTETCKNEL